MSVVAAAQAAAFAWVRDEARRMPGYRAAFIAGSITGLPADTVLPPWTDTDVMVVLDGEVPAKAGKFRSRGVLLEGTYLASDGFRDLDALLGSYHGANALATGEIIDDPAGWLSPIQAAVRREFPRRHWVEVRCADARTRAEPAIRVVDMGSLAERAQAWVFPTGVMTHILLVAGLRNPTVRRRYETARELLVEHDRLDLHERLLGVLGCRDWDRATAARHLATVTQLFDATAPVDAPTYRFASDITDVSRPISIDGSRDMIERGLHREAAFWLVVTGSRALQKLAHGAGPASAAPFEPGYSALLDDLGVGSLAKMLTRLDAALALLPEVWDAASAIMDATPEIVP